MAELEQAGHVAVAPDLPSEDVEADAPEYARVVLDAIGDAEDVVVVGHSLGGLTAPLVAAARPVRRLVLLAALLPDPGHSLVDQLRADRGILLFPPDALTHDDQRRSRWKDAEQAAASMYSDCPVMVAAAAFARLRPQAATPQVRPTPLETWPDVPTEYVVFTADRTVSPTWGAGRAREHGWPVREFTSGHSPMLSRPADLAELLLSYSA